MVLPPGAAAFFFKFQFSAQSIDTVVGAATRRPLRLSVTNSLKPNANSQYFSARATNGRPYMIHVTLRNKYQFTLYMRYNRLPFSMVMR